MHSKTPKTALIISALRKVLFIQRQFRITNLEYANLETTRVLQSLFYGNLSSRYFFFISKKIVSTVILKHIYYIHVQLKGSFLYVHPCVNLQHNHSQILFLLSIADHSYYECLEAK